MTLNSLKSLLIVLTLLTVAITLPSQINSQNKMREPDFGPVPDKLRDDVYYTSTPRFIGECLIIAFSRWISPVDGARSPSYPTGSAYGKAAVSKHGVIIGVVLTADRLLHESDVHQGPLITIHGTQRYYDPLEANTFWWTRSD